MIGANRCAGAPLDDDAHKRGLTPRRVRTRLSQLVELVRCRREGILPFPSAALVFRINNLPRENCSVD